MEPPPEIQRSEKQAPGVVALDAPALEMEDVTIGSIRDSERVVLRNVNWRVQVGEYWAVLGLQATGKTDLLSTAAGLMRPLAGHHRVFGSELTPGYEHEQLAARLRIGLVYSGGRLLQHLSIAENLLLPLHYHHSYAPDDLDERLRVLLEFIGLTRHAESYPNSLSLAWQQRVGLARALALEPGVLLLDNPLSSLDLIHIAWWVERLDELSAGHPLLSQRPLTLVVTGDDLRLWDGHARQFAFLKEGHLLVVGAGATRQDLLRELTPVPAEARNVPASENRGPSNS